MHDMIDLGYHDDILATQRASGKMRREQRLNRKHKEKDEWHEKRRS